MKKINREIISFQKYPHADFRFPCSHPTPNRLYVKILQYINNHPFCTRLEIHQAVLNRNNTATHSTEWVSILDAGLVYLYRDGRQVKYRLTKKGHNLLLSMGLY